MGTSSRQVAREVVAAREDLGQTLDEIERRVRREGAALRTRAVVVGGLGILGGLTGWLFARRRGGD